QPGLLLGLARVAWIGGRNFEAGLGRQLPDGVHELQPALIGHPANHIAVRAAAEAMVETLLVVDREAGRLLVMERTTRLPFAPGLLQLGRAHDHAGQRDTRAQFVEPLGRKGHRTRAYARSAILASAQTCG